MNNRFSIFFATGSLLATAGCVSTKMNYQPETTQISVPALNSEQSVALGDHMLEQGSKTIMDGIVVAMENNIKGYKLSPGFFPKIGEDGEHTFHSLKTGQSFDGMGTVLSASDFLGIPLSTPQSLRAAKGKQELCIITGMSPVCDTEHTYVTERRPALSSNDFQQTLIYNGRVGNEIKVAYREFSGSMARQAFANEVQYDLSSSNEISYRGARIRVIEANNQRIRYVVLSNFNTAQ